MAIQHLPTHHHQRPPHYITYRTVMALIGAALVTVCLTLRAVGVFHSPDPIPSPSSPPPCEVAVAGVCQ